LQLALVEQGGVVAIPDRQEAVAELTSKIVELR
jgi:hypothetical protein